VVYYTVGLHDCPGGTANPPPRFLDVASGIACFGIRTVFFHLPLFTHPGVPAFSSAKMRHRSAVFPPSPWHFLFFFFFHETVVSPRISFARQSSYGSVRADLDSFDSPTFSQDVVFYSWVLLVCLALCAFVHHPLSRPPHPFSGKHPDIGSSGLLRFPSFFRFPTVSSTLSRPLSRPTTVFHCRSDPGVLRASSLREPVTFRGPPPFFPHPTDRESAAVPEEWPLSSTIFSHCRLTFFPFGSVFSTVEPLIFFF